LSLAVSKTSLGAVHKFCMFTKSLSCNIFDGEKLIPSS